MRLISYDRPGYGGSTPQPGVEARLLDDDGHLTLLQHRIPEVHEWLSARL